VFSTVDSGLTNLIHDRCSCTLFTLSPVSSSAFMLGSLQSDISNRFVAPSVSGLFTLGWMCPLKREQARRERESELRLVNSL